MENLRAVKASKLKRDRRAERRLLKAACNDLGARPRIRELGLRVLYSCGYARAQAFIERNSGTSS